jgi:chromosome partitioning protein
MAQEHRKPVFHLTPADGAIGSHAFAVADAKSDFRKLVNIIGEKIGVE